LCKVKVGKKKAHPSFTAVLRLIVIFLTEIFELAASGSNRRKFPKNYKSLRRLIRGAFSFGSFSLGKQRK
jgi:hypothetical protein